MWGAWKVDVTEIDRQRAAQYGKTYGVFEGTEPMLMTTDTDLIRSIYVKDFDHFVNRRVNPQLTLYSEYLTFKADSVFIPISSKDFALKDKYSRKFVSLIRNQEWKDVRSAVTPAFTTGKIKTVYYGLFYSAFIHLDITILFHV